MTYQIKKGASDETWFAVSDERVLGPYPTEHYAKTAAAHSDGDREAMIDECLAELRRVLTDAREWGYTSFDGGKPQKVYADPSSMIFVFTLRH